jgi:hypothetical protein
LDIALLVGRCEDSTCSVFTLLLIDDTTFGAIALDETHTLSLAWDGVQFFTFGVDDQLVTFDPTAEAPVIGPARVPFKGIGTHVRGITAPEDSATVVATFDNVFVDMAP